MDQDKLITQVASDGSNGSGELSKPILLKNGRFDNPWPTWRAPRFIDGLRLLLFNKNNSNVPTKEEVLDETLPVHQVTDAEIYAFCANDTTDQIKVIWIGHATSLVNMQNTIILMDPLFSQRCSPFQFLGYKRYRPVPITISRLPRVDAVVISHNHYDHLDEGSVRELQARFGQRGLTWYVGAGTGAWFRSVGVPSASVRELSWWESARAPNGLEFAFTPSQHWCGRGLFDRNKALWGGWAIMGARKRLYFAGDTGYCKCFSEIGRKYGPFDLAFVPIGAYEPTWFMNPQHVTPEQAVQVHMDVRAKQSVAVHWATFALAYEFYLEPKQALAEALEKNGLEKNSFITVQHGKTHTFN